MATNPLHGKSQVPIEYLNDQFIARVESLLQEYHIPGISIAVVDNGNISAKGFGLARFPDVLASPTTLYHTGSTTKAMIAAASGILIHQQTESSNALLKTLQKNKWATTIRSLLPEFQLEDKDTASKITIEDALSHRTGLSGADYMYGPWMGRDPKTIVGALDQLGSLNKPFRTEFQYNNLMYSTVGACLTAITGLDCGDLLRNVLWDPLGMSSTFWTLNEIPKEQRKDLARGYYWVDKPSQSANEKGYYTPEPYIDLAGIAPAGSNISSVIDYAKWIMELLTDTEKDCRHQTKHVLPPGLVSELFTPRTFVFDPQLSQKGPNLAPIMYALGWMVSPPLAGLDHPIVYHAGGLNGFGTQLYLLPKDGFGVITLANTELSGNIVGSIICLELIAKKLGIQDEAKGNFIEALKLKVPKTPPEQDDDAAMPEVLKPTSQTTERAAAFMKAVSGEYYQQAWGYFNISKYEPAEQTSRITNLPWVSRADQEERDDRRSRIPCLWVTPIGKRTWKYGILLHPRLDSIPFNGSLPPTSTAHSSQNEEIFFDLEVLNGHGNVEDDAVVDFDTGCENFGDDGILRSEKHWHSQSWSQYGAVFKLVGDRTKDFEQHPNKLGMRLATAFITTDGSTGKGFEKEMVWLTKK